MIPSAGDRVVFDRIQDYVTAHIDAQAALELSHQELEHSIAALVERVVSENSYLLNQQEQREISLEILNDMVRLGPLQPLIDDAEISDILVNGADRIYVERRGKLELSGVRFRDDGHVLNMAQRIANSVSRRVDVSSPMVDARLPDGSRVNIVIPPLSLSGPCISIRRFVRRKLYLAELVEIGSMSREMAKLLQLGVEARVNMLISGGTGAGKTTLLNAMSAHIGTNERIITIEDVAELELWQSHVISLETRTEGLEGQGLITQRDLVRNALRMRPERIILGEVRGEEAFDMLQAMNTGHDGSLSTLHANSPDDALARLQDMLRMASAGFDAVHTSHQISSSIEWVVQIERAAEGQRRVTHISELHFEDGFAVTRPIYHYRVGDDGVGAFVRTGDVGRARDKFRRYGLFDRLAELSNHGS